MVLLTINTYAYTIDEEYVEFNYSVMSKAQKENIRYAHKIGERLHINGDTYGNTIAAITYLESMSGLVLIGDNDASFGFTHMGIPRTREILKVSVYYSDMLHLTDKELGDKLEKDTELNLRLASLNFKLNLAKWGTYSKAVRAHNGYNPKRNIYNKAYYARFVNALEVVKLVMNEEIENEK